MTRRRFLSLWFPRLAAERALRRAPDPEAPLAVVAEDGPARVLSSLSAAASAAGLTPGQPLRDALAICPGLVTRPADPPGEAAFLDALRRHAVRFSPRVAAAGPDGLDADITGVAHLFGGEAALAQAALADAGRLGLTLRIGIADTPGAARALARFGPGDARAPRAGPDGAAIAEEARATRARAAAPPRPAVGPADGGAGIAIAPVGELYGQALAPLPVAALRIAAGDRRRAGAAGSRTIGDILGMPRAGLARRFGPILCAASTRRWGWSPSRSPPPPHRSISPCGSACRSRSGWRMTSSRVSTASPPCSATSSARRDAAPGACGWNSRASMAKRRCWRSASPAPPTGPTSSAPSSRSRPAASTRASASTACASPRP
jgi:protein ImuB